MSQASEVRTDAPTNQETNVEDRPGVQWSLRRQEKRLRDEFDARLDARVALVIDARTVLGQDFDHKGKSDRDIQMAVIQKVDAAFVADGKSDDAVNEIFDAVVRTVATERTQLGRVNETTARPAMVDDSAKSSVDAAAERMAKRHADAWKPRTGS